MYFSGHSWEEGLDIKVQTYQPEVSTKPVKKSIAGIVPVGVLLGTFKSSTKATKDCVPLGGPHVPCKQYKSQLVDSLNLLETATIESIV